jgi:hypothetical protein
MLPSKGHYTKNEKMQIKNRHKLASNTRARRHKMNGHKTRAGYTAII